MTTEIGELKEIVDLSDSHKDEVEVIGSYSIRSLIYPSDIDLQQVITNVNVDEFINRLQHKLKSIKNYYMGMIFFMEFKAGMRNSIPLKWTLSEILKGYMSTIRGIIPLKDAILGTKSIIKLDLIVDYRSRFKEVTCNYYLENKEENINTRPEFFESIERIYAFQFQKFLATKKIKSIKRLFFILKKYLEKNKNLEFKKFARDILTFLNSDIGRLNYNISNIEVLKSLLEKYKDKVDYKVVNKNLIMIQQTSFSKRMRDEIGKLFLTKDENSYKKIISDTELLTEKIKSMIQKISGDFLKKHSRIIQKIMTEIKIEN